VTCACGAQWLGGVCDNCGRTQPRDEARGTVGGTLAARICGLSKYGGPLSAYFEMTADVQAERRPEMSRGTMLEESVLALGKERLGPDIIGGWTHHPVPVRPQTMPHAHATLDALWWSPDGRTIILPDAKTVNTESMGEDWGPDGSDQVPAEYHAQLLWYHGVCRAAGMNVADEALLPTLCGPEAELQWAARLVQKTGGPLVLADLEGTGLELRVYRVEWDPEAFRLMDERVRRFLREHVEPRVPPEPGPGDLLERDLRAVAKGLKAEPGRVLDFDRLPPAEQALVLELLDANRQRKAWADKEEQAAARVRLLMATAEEVRGLPGGARVTWRERQSGRVFMVSEPRGGK
jgi:hypothetical protein